MPLPQMLDNFFSTQRPLFSLSSRVWNPPTDIYEDGDRTFIKMEIAGLDERAIQITAQRNILIIRGRREHTSREQSINFHLMEVHYGAFERAFAFSFDLNEDKVKASYEQGFLLIEVERVAPAVTRVSVRIVDDPSAEK